MKQFATIVEMRAQVHAWRAAGKRVAFVPTMGNLHAGHLSLVAQAETLADHVIVSIFVNPLQFDDTTDLVAYPRTFAADEAALSDSACDAVFTPSSLEIYPNGMAKHTTVHVSGADDKLCGARRAGQFDGVATVVNKLLNIVQPDVAVLGEKDYQQLWVLRKMVADLAMPVEIAGGITHREADGLAMSSRNQYLTESERARAPQLHRILQSIAVSVQAGGTDFDGMTASAMKQLSAIGFEPEYIDIRRADTLALAVEGDADLRVFAAARLGKARLIDNVPCRLELS